MKCINKNHKEFKKLVEDTGIKSFILETKVGAWQDENNTDSFPLKDEIINYVPKSNEVLKTLKSVDVLLNLNTKQKQFFNSFNKGKLTAQQLVDKIQIPKEHKSIVIDSIDNFKGDLTPEVLALELATNYSFTVEINTATENIQKIAGNYQDGFSINGDNYIFNPIYDDYQKNGKSISQEEYDIAFDKFSNASKNVNTQHYSNLTVPGGANYTENEISTPLITPSIKGHAQFSTPSGIGWFRSDEKESGKRGGEPIYEESPFGEQILVDSTEGDIGSKTRRILEVQSDLFQKGRGKKDLVKFQERTSNSQQAYIERDADELTDQVNIDGFQYIWNDYYNKGFKYPEGVGIGTEDSINKGIEITKEEYLKASNKASEKVDKKQNQFFQFLNKSNNWVTFFVKSIIQDSAKKGYEKVLFPTGNTIIKIEQFDKVDEQLNILNNKLKTLTDTKVEDNGYNIWFYETGVDNESGGPFDSKEEAEKSLNNNIEKTKRDLKQFESTNKKVLKTINFYENTVTNILNKTYGKENVKVITDEYGNKWNEVKIESDEQYKPIALQKTRSEVIKKSNVKQHLGRYFLKELFPNQVSTLKRLVDAKSSRLSIQNAGYHYEVKFSRIGQSEQYTWELTKEPGNIDLDKKLQKEKNNLVDPGQSTRGVEQAQRNVNKKNKGGDQLSLFQKIEALSLDKLEEVYKRDYGVNFTDFVEETNNQEFEMNDRQQRQINTLKEKFGVEVKLDNTIVDNQGNPVSGKLLKDGTIVINPDYLQEDTVTHEFAHLFIEILGRSNMRVKAAIQKLKGTELWNEIKELYPELSERNLEMEVLATAIGTKSNELFNREFDRNWWDRFVDWFLDILAFRLNSSKDIIKELSNEMLTKSPNTSKEFKNLIFEFNQKFKPNISKYSLKNVLTKTHDNLAIKMERWKSAQTKVDDEGYTVENPNLAKIKELQSEIVKYINEENVLGLINIIELIEKNYEDIVKKLQNDEVDSETLNLLDNYKASFDFIEDINLFIRKNPSKLDIMDKEQKDKFINDVNNLMAQKEDIQNDITDFEKQILATKFANLGSSFIKAKHKLRLEKEFNEANNLEDYNNKSEFNNALNKYIEDNLNEDDVKKESYEYFMNKFEVGADIGAAYKFLDSGQVNSQIIQIVQKMFDSADMKINSSIIAKRMAIKELQEEYKELFGENVNQDEMFSAVLEQGEHHDYLVTKYDAKLIEEYYDLKRKIRELDDNKEYLNKLVEWKSKYLTNNKLNENAENEKYKKLNEKQKTFLEKIKRTIEKDDKHLFHFDKLHLEFKNVSFYKLPSSTKGLSQRTREISAKDNLKKTLEESVYRQSDDELFGNPESGLRSVFSNEKDEPTNRVPVFYRSKLNKRDRSRDLFTNLLSNHITTENFRQKSLLAADMEILSDVLEDKKYLNIKDGKTLISKLGQKLLGGARKLKDDKKVSRERDMLNSIMEHRLYGVGEISEVINGVSLNKIASFMNSWSSSVMLGLNYFAFMPNLMMGQSTNIAEAVGGNIFNTKDYMKATGEYWKDFGNFMQDINKAVPKSKTGLLLDYFEVLNEGTKVGTKFIDDGKMRALFKKDSIFALSHMAEHNIQATLMYAVLNSKEYNGKKLIDHIKVKDGRLFLNLPEKELEKTRYLIKKVIADNHGQYDSRMKNMYQRTWYGSSAFMFRKWIVRGTTKRWKGGLNSIFKDFDKTFENEDLDKYFSQESEQFEEGNYISFFRLLLKDFKQYKFNYMKKYNKMTAYEQANVKRTLTEFGLYFGMFLTYTLFSSMAKGEDDDELKNWYYLNAYWFKRTQGELAFWINPIETLNIIRSPAAALSMVEKIGKFASELVPITGWNRYERAYGKYEEGDLKILKRMEDITALQSQIWRYQNPQEALSWLIK